MIAESIVEYRYAYFKPDWTTEELELDTIVDLRLEDDPAGHRAVRRVVRDMGPRKRNSYRTYDPPEEVYGIEPFYDFPELDVVIGHVGEEYNVFIPRDLSPKSQWHIIIGRITPLVLRNDAYFYPGKSGDSWPVYLGKYWTIEGAGKAIVRAWLEETGQWGRPVVGP